MAAAAVSQNDRLVLSERPKRGPITNKTFRRERVQLGELAEGQVLVRVDHVSIDPTMRNWLNPWKSYLPPVEIGAVMRAGGVGRVIASKAPTLAEGDLVFGTLGWQEYWVGPPKALQRVEWVDLLRENPADVRLPPGARDIDYLGFLGTSGLTAYFGMFDIGRLKDGDTVLVSAAAGSVGLVATQIALAHRKCTVAAIAGGKDKCAHLKQMGCHHVLDYKSPEFKNALRAVGPIDVYFDNVGGEILDLVLTQLRDHARIVACGQVTAYNAKESYGLKNTPALTSSKAKMEGFIILDYAPRYAEGRTYLSDLHASGKLKYDYTILSPVPGENGLGRCVEALHKVFQGENMGKTLVKISRDDSGRQAKL